MRRRETWGEPKGERSRQREYTLQRQRVKSASGMFYRWHKRAGGAYVPRIMGRKEEVGSGRMSEAHELAPPRCCAWAPLELWGHSRPQLLPGPLVGWVQESRGGSQCHWALWRTSGEHGPSHLLPASQRNCAGGKSPSRTLQR